MKKGRLAFTNGQFVPVESAAAAAKRLRASENAQAASAAGTGRVSKPKRSRVTPKRLEGSETAMPPGRWGANGKPQVASRHSAPAVAGREQTPRGELAGRGAYGFGYDAYQAETGHGEFNAAVLPRPEVQAGAPPHAGGRSVMGTPVTPESEARQEQTENASSIRRLTAPSPSFPRPLSRHQSATGLYSLLAAIDFIDGAGPLQKN